MELNQLELAVGLVGGLTLFLFGMDIMTRALKQVAGASMKTILARMTGNRFMGLAAGATVTAIIQSSSITTVLLVGFVSAGLMNSAQSVAVIMGANIGTTITAQILAFKVTALALPVLSLGFFVSFIAKNKSTREYGRVLLGIGMVFFGMVIMSDAMRPLRGYQPFLDFMLSLDSVFLAALVGAGFTAMVQSSSATTGILIVMASQGLIALEPAVALALGANIGTCITAMLAAIGKRREAVRVAIVHTLFNVAGVLLWIGFVEELAEFSRQLSAAVGMDEGGIPRQLANIHTFFNLANALMFIGFTGQISRLVEWLVPDRAERPELRFASKHLDAKLLDVPAIAIDAARLEVLHLGGLVHNLLSAAIPSVTTGRPVDIDKLHLMDRPVDLLHREIVGYLREISAGSLPPDQSDLLIGLVRIANDLEHIGDLVANSMVTSARKRIDEDVVISPATAEVIAGLHCEAVEALEGVISSLERQDVIDAKTVIAMKAGFAELVENIAAHEMERLRADEPKRLHTYTREIELTETLDDIFKVIRRIARTELAILPKPERDNRGRSRD